MRNSTRFWLIFATVLILAGGILFTLVMNRLRWDFTALSTVKKETVSIDVNGSFDSISVYAETADLILAPSPDGRCRVVCVKPEHTEASAAVEAETLTVRQTDSRNVRDRLVLFDFSGPSSITVYLPGTAYQNLSVSNGTGDVDIPSGFRFGRIDISTATGDTACMSSAEDEIRIEMSTGDIRLENLNAGSLSLSVSTGKIELQSVSCRGEAQITVSTGEAELTDVSVGSLASTGTTGDISLRNVIAEGPMNLRRTTGDVRFSGCDAGELHISSSTGSVTGTLRTSKAFSAKTSTGSVKVPATGSGGICEITTTTGDIRIEIA